MIPSAPLRGAMLRIGLLFVPISLTLLLTVRIGAAAEFPEPKRDYSAEVTMQLSDGGGREQFSSRGKEYYSSGKRRREMSMMGRESVHITRPDKGVSWTLIPSMQTYVEHRDGQSKDGRGDVPDPLAGGDGVEMEKIGSETVNGVKADKYRVRMKEGTGTAWMTSDNIPVRFEGNMESEGRQMQIRMDYENIQIGPQQDSLFELPSGYRGGASFGMPMMPAGAPPGSNGRAPTDAEVEAYKNQVQDSMEALRKQMEQMRRGQPGGR